MEKPVLKITHCQPWNLYQEKEQEENSKFIQVLIPPFITVYKEESQQKLCALEIGVTPKRGITIFHHLCNMKPQTKILERKNIVYSIPCITCGKIYIGETGQRFCNRRGQHQRDVRTKKQTNGIFDHLKLIKRHQIGWDKFCLLDKES